MTRIAFALILCAALPATAQELRFDPAPLAACLADGGGRDCIGAAAETCMAATEGGYSTAGMVGCLAAEHDWWDDALNAAYRDLRAREQAIDARPEPQPGAGPRPSGADAIRDVQRAWIAWRDATCRYEHMQWWGGTGAAVAANACLLQRTAEQTLMLKGYLADG